MRSQHRAWWGHALPALVLVAPRLVYAHGGEAPALEWSWEPAVVVPIVASVLLYALGVARLWRSSGVGGGVRVAAALSYFGGWISLVIALLSPLHPLGRYLFSAHMGQHEILMLVAAPLLVLGRPLIAFTWALPRGWRPVLARMTKRAGWQRLWSLLTMPLVAWLVHAVALWIWHVPALFEATLDDELVHAAQHLSFLLSALLFWWAMIGARGRAAYGAAVLYVFSTSVHSGLLGALLTFATTVWYPSYAHTSRHWHLAPLEDQQLGGLLMWIPAGVVYTIAGLALMAAWLQNPRRSAAAPDLRALAASKVHTIGVLLVIVLAASGCEDTTERAAAGATGGDVERGRVLLINYGCHTCHTIPGIRGHAVVGPPLAQFGARSYIAGRRNNTPADLMQWIRDPQSIDDQTAMPNLGVTEQDARDIAAYLYTLR